MPFNRSEQKIRVVHTHGTGSAIGLMNPKVDMNVRHGNDLFWIESLDSGNFQVGLALSSGGAVVRKAYCHEITLDDTIAPYFGFPNGANNPVKLGHSGIFGPPNGVPDDVNTNSMSYLGGDGLIHNAF
jgi:hypothetical protein